MKVTLLGTGTPTPSLTRQSSGLVIEVEDDLIVIDHGPGAHQRLLEAGYRAVDVTRACFTHLHYDHCIEYPRLVLQRWDMGGGRIPDLEVVGPPPLGRMTELLFGPDGVFWPDIVARTEHEGSLVVYRARGGEGERAKPRPRVREVVPGDVVEGRGWRLTVGLSRHVQPQLACYGYRLETPEASFCYAGDSGGNYEPVVELARSCDVLVHMVHYETGAEPSATYREVCGSHLDVAETAKRAGVGTLVCTHMLEHIDRPGVRERLIVEMARVFDGTIVWGHDLLEIPFGTAPARRID